MTTFISFTPVALGIPFQFQVTLDGNEYNCIASWNLFRPDWYLNIYDLNGSLVLARPFVGSPSPLPLAAPVETETVTSMTWTTDGGGTLHFIMGDDSVFVLNDSILVQGATNSGTGGDSIVNGEFVINTWTDPQHFTAFLNAGAGVVGTIGGQPELVLTTYGLSWSNATGIGLVTAHTAAPHGIPLGEPTSLVIANAVPSGYNGRYLCSPTTPSDFTYSIPSNPGTETVPGTFSPDINLVAGYFTSEMIWRPIDNRFEINP